MRYLLYALVVLSAYQVLIRLARKLVHFPAPAFIGRFLDSGLRRAMQPAAPLIRRSGVEPGMRLLEVGCGSGAYTVQLARAVGSAGRVFALDVQPTMLDQLRSKLDRAANRDARNVEPLPASAYGIPLDDGSVDAVLLVTVLQEIPDKRRALVEIRRVLRPDGIIAVTEWLFDPDYPLRRTTARILREAGFEKLETLGNLWTYTVRGRRC